MAPCLILYHYSVTFWIGYYQCLLTIILYQHGLLHTNIVYSIPTWFIPYIHGLFHTNMVYSIITIHSARDTSQMPEDVHLTSKYFAV